MEHLIPVLGQQIRTNIRVGTGVPLVLCNGFGASLEVLDPLVEHLNPDTTVVRFDVPGTGASPDSPLPYGFPYLAVVLGRLLRKLGLDGPVDVAPTGHERAARRRDRLQHVVASRNRD